VTAINIFPNQRGVLERVRLLLPGMRVREHNDIRMKQFFAVIYSPGKNWIDGKSIFEQPLDGHVAYVKSLNEDGTVLLAGPFRDDDGGLTILQAESDEEARLIIDEDPDVRAGILRADVRPWRPLALDRDGAQYESPPLVLTRVLDGSNV
jgi:uncharacterized protein YciI